MTCERERRFRLASGFVHFNPDPVKVAELHRLRHLLDLIRTLNT